MDSNSIESVINLLTGDKTVAKQLINFSKSINNKDNDDNSTALTTHQQESTDRLQLKINLINAIIPLLSDKATEQAQFLVKLLSVISVIKKINGENE